MRASLRPALAAAAVVLAGVSGTALPAAAAAQPARPTAWSDRGDPAGAEAEVVATYRRMLDALRRRDTVALKAVLAPDYLFTRGTTAEVSGLAERIRGTADPAGGIVTTLRVDGCRTRFHGAAAVAMCQVAEEGRTRDGRPFGGVVASTVVLVRDGAAGGWRVAATHTSPAPGYSMP